MFERIQMLIPFFRIFFFVVYFVTKMLFGVVYGLWLRVRCFVCFNNLMRVLLMNNKFNLIDNDPLEWNAFLWIIIDDIQKKCQLVFALDELHNINERLNIFKSTTRTKNSRKPLNNTSFVYQLVLCLLFASKFQCTQILSVFVTSV